MDSSLDSLDPIRNRTTILIVDDDESMRDLLESILRNDYRVIAVPSGSHAMSIIEQDRVDVVLLDIRLGEENGLDILLRIKQFRPNIEVIMITVVHDVQTAVTAIKRGAFDYINKDFDYDDVKKLVVRAVEHQQKERELIYLRSEIQQHVKREMVFGTTEAMRKVKIISQKAANVPATVLITGESGTGKEMLARQIHEWSTRAKSPFVAINLASIPTELIESALFGHERGSFTGAYAQQLGKFEVADGGTLFLDEIGDLQINLQTKLLRAIQENEIERIGSTKPIPINVRLIAATNIDLKSAVSKGTFREELYYRLNVLPIHLPPLRERREDIPQLIDLFIHRYCHRFHRPIKRLEPAALDILCQHYWPGNIRELENLMERMVAISEGTTITEFDIPVEYRISPFPFSKGSIKMQDALKAAVEGFERAFILQVLEEENWHQAKTAQRLGIHRKTLEYKMRRLNIERGNTKLSKTVLT
jgi:DNA-binding NtrC family response regulator